MIHSPGGDKKPSLDVILILANLVMKLMRLRSFSVKKSAFSVSPPGHPCFGSSHGEMPLNQGMSLGYGHYIIYGHRERPFHSGPIKGDPVARRGDHQSNIMYKPADRLASEHNWLCSRGQTLAKHNETNTHTHTRTRNGTSSINERKHHLKQPRTYILTQMSCRAVSTISGVCNKALLLAGSAEPSQSPEQSTMNRTANLAAAKLQTS